VRENLNNLIGAIYGGIGGGVGGGGMGPLMGIMFGGLHMAGAAAAVFVPAWLALVYGVAHTSYHYSAKKRERTLGDLADRLADLARELNGPQQRLLPR
jgi:hypothetical protein